MENEINEKEDLKQPHFNMLDHYVFPKVGMFILLLLTQYNSEQNKSSVQTHEE